MSNVEPTPFVRFGPDHLAALGITLLLAVALGGAARRGPRASAWVRGGLAAIVLAGLVGYVVLLWRRQILSIWALLPLHACDLLLIVAVLALLTRGRLACELLYYGAGAGTLLALVTPDVGRGWPDPWFVVFFAFHGLVVVSAAVVVFGAGRWPRRGSSLRVFAWLNAYALAVGAVDWAWGTNYLYLRRKPVGATLLDGFGPWPWYILVADLLALGLFALLEVATRAAPDTIGTHRSGGRGAIS